MSAEAEEPRMAELTQEAARARSRLTSDIEALAYKVSPENLKQEAMEAGYQGEFVGAAYIAPLAASYFNMRKTTIYGGSNEVQRNIVSQVVLG